MTISETAPRMAVPQDGIKKGRCQGRLGHSTKDINHVDSFEVTSRPLNDSNPLLKKTTQPNAAKCKEGKHSRLGSTLLSPYLDPYSDFLWDCWTLVFLSVKWEPAGQCLSFFRFIFIVFN